MHNCNVYFPSCVYNICSWIYNTEVALSFSIFPKLAPLIFRELHFLLNLRPFLAELLLLLLLSRFSRVRLCATPWTAAHQAPPSMGFSRQEYWSGVPSPSPYIFYIIYFLTKYVFNIFKFQARILFQRIFVFV